MFKLKRTQIKVKLCFSLH